VSDLKIPSRGISLLVGSEDGVNMEAEYYKSKDKRIRFKSGWKEFAANNNLTAGVAVLIMFHMRRSTVKISFDVIRY
jgi:type II secretory pathway component PulL